MIKHKDEIPVFIPKGNVNFIILGTMGSINARSIDDQKPEGEFFYYNNSRNHFWKVIQLLLNPKKEAEKNWSVKDKKAFLQKHGIAMTNIVDEAIVPNKDALDPSDTILFDAHKKGRVTFKTLSPRFRKLMKTTPLFFTCRRKPGIEKLLLGLLQENNLENDLINHVWYWPTPTRCNPLARSILWKKEMDVFLDSIAYDK